MVRFWSRRMAVVRMRDTLIGWFIIMISFSPRKTSICVSRIQLVGQYL